MNCLIKRSSAIHGSIIAVLLMVNSIGAADEFNKMELYQESLKNRLLTSGPTDDPPPQPAIGVAEWEPATGVLITYPLSIPISLVAEMAEDVEVWSVVNNASNMQQALQDYVHAGVDTSHCHFLFTGFGSWPWTRDFGPWYIINGDDEQGMIDNNYYGGISGQVPQILGDSLNIPVYSTGLLAEGGNYMTDGMGTAFATTRIYTINPSFTTQQIDGIFEEYLGIPRLFTVPHPFSAYIAHIDVHAKLLDPGRIMVIEPSPVNQQLEQNVAYFSTLMSAYGRPFEILRVQGSGYSNSLILNNKVLVAQFGNANDSMAVVTYQEAMPGYEVQGFYQGSFNFGDALHCRTHEMADPGMLRIVHVPVHDCENTGAGYYLEANIHPYSNEPLIGPPVIMWKTEGGVYSPVAMTSAGDDIYNGEIPQQPDETDIYYYLEAEDGSGRVENHPYIGPGNPHHFHVGPDTESPVVDFRPPQTLLAPEWPYTFTTYALDNRWISAVTLEHSINGIPQDDADMPLEEPYAVFYTGAPTSTLQPGDVVEVRVKAIDTSVNQNTTYSPYYTITIEAAPAFVVTLTPYNPPIQIPANGGTFDFNITIENNDPAQQTFDAWIMVQLPDASWYGPVLGPSLAALASGEVIDRDRTQSVPANAPEGVYAYVGYIGAYPDVIWTEDQIGFEKLGTSDGSKAIGDWFNWGETLTGAVAQDETSVPNSFTLYGAYPNPFNPITTISYQLSVARRVSLSVYDITGRIVAKLVNGWRDAGVHEITFDASNISSGVYLYRLTSGQEVLTGKIVLLK